MHAGPHPPTPALPQEAASECDSLSPPHLLRPKPEHHRSRVETVGSGYECLRRPCPGRAPENGTTQQKSYVSPTCHLRVRISRGTW